MFSQKFSKDTHPKDLSIYIENTGSLILDIITTEPFKQVLVSGTSGSIVIENIEGKPYYMPIALTGVIYPCTGRRILTNATIDGILRSTTATGIFWMGGI